MIDFAEKYRILLHRICQLRQRESDAAAGERHAEAELRAESHVAAGLAVENAELQAAVARLEHAASYESQCAELQAAVLRLEREVMTPATAIWYRVPQKL